MRRYQVGGWCDWVIGKGPLYIGKSGHLVSFCRSLTHRLCKTDLLSSLYKYEWRLRNTISSTALMTFSSSPCHLQGQPSLPGSRHGRHKKVWQTKLLGKKFTWGLSLNSRLVIFIHSKKMLNGYLILQLVRLHSKVTKKVIFSTCTSLTCPSVYHLSFNNYFQGKHKTQLFFK